MHTALTCTSLACTALAVIEDQVKMLAAKHISKRHDKQAHKDVALLHDEIRTLNATIDAAVEGQELLKV